MVLSTTPATAKTLPFTDEQFLLGSYQAFFQDRLGFLTRLAQQGDVIGFHIGPVPILLFNKAEHAHYLLVEHANEFYKGKLMRRASRKQWPFCQ